MKQFLFSFIMINFYEDFAIHLKFKKELSLHSDFIYLSLFIHLFIYCELMLKSYTRSFFHKFLVFKSVICIHFSVQSAWNNFFFYIHNVCIIFFGHISRSVSFSETFRSEYSRSFDYDGFSMTISRWLFIFKAFSKVW